MTRATRYAPGRPGSAALVVLALMGAALGPSGPAGAAAKPVGLDKGSPAALRGPGILVANCYVPTYGTGGWLQLKLLDPADGSVLAAHFFPGQSCPDEGHRLNFLEHYDLSFRYELAGATLADGANDIGYRDLASGRFTDVSRTEPRQAGFGAPLTNDTRGAFSPTSEAIWWQTGANVMCSEPVGGQHPSSHGKVVESMYAGNNDQFLLAPVSSLPIREGTVTSPDGRSGVVQGKAVPAGAGYPGSGITYFQGADMLTEAKGSYWAWAGSCNPVAWVSTTRLLCETVEQVPYVLGLTAPHKQFDLLPANSRTNNFFVSNGRGEVAFMSQLGSGRPQLYRVPATGPGARPVLVATLPSLADGVDAVVSWVP